MCPNNFKVMGGRAMSIKCVQMEITISCMLFIAEGKQHRGPEFNFNLGVLLPKTCDVCFLSFNTDEQLASHIPVYISISLNCLLMIHCLQFQGKRQHHAKPLCVMNVFYSCQQNVN